MEHEQIPNKFFSENIILLTPSQLSECQVLFFPTHKPFPQQPVAKAILATAGQVSLKRFLTTAVSANLAAPLVNVITSCRESVIP